MNKLGHVTTGIKPGFFQDYLSVQQLLSDIFTSHHHLDIIYLDITKAFDMVSHSN